MLQSQGCCGVDDGNDNSAVIFGDIHTKLSGGRSTKETIVLDSGCSRDIVAQSIVSDERAGQTSPFSQC